jgi:hypothetical protein
MRFDSLSRSLAARPARGTRLQDVVSAFGASSLSGISGLRASRRDRFTSAVACPTGRVVCDDVCVSPWLFEHDAQNCGACGNSCGHGAVCCDGRCVDLTADSANCGACGASCADGAFCAAGECL